VERAKAMMRQSMAAEGMPPDQIEAELDSAVARTQKWLDDGMPNAAPPEGVRPPPPGFGDGFADHWFAAEQGIKNLIGQGGLGAPGVHESWEQTLKGMTDTVQNPLGAAAGEFQNALDSPSAAYFLGGKAADGAVALPGMMFGGEGAGLGELADVNPAAVYDGVGALPHSPIGLDNLIRDHPWGPSAGQDFFSALVHGEPTEQLGRQLADMTTHYVGDNPDRVVLGKWEGNDAGYIGEARAHGGIYFNTGDDTWKALTEGLSKPDEIAVAWPVNEYFLRNQMENHVGRIEYIFDHDKYSSLEAMAFERSGSYSAMEVDFLIKNAAAYGYERVGNAWVYVGGGS
jgi:hypothetical protein